MEKLDTIVSRLESAVSRLEAYERGAPVPSGTRAAAAAPAPSAPVKTFVSAAPAAPASSAPPASGSPVADLDALLTNHLTPFEECAASLGGDVEKVSGIVARAFKALRTLVDIASQSKKPDDAELQNLVTPLSTELIAASKLTEGRRSNSYNHYKAVAEALQAFTFVVYSGPACGMSPPSQLIIECWQSGEFYANKIMMEFKGKDQAQVDWVKLLKELMMKLQQHVRIYHPTGLKWNPSGGDPSAAAPTATPSAPSPTPSAPSPTPSAPSPTPPSAPPSTTPAPTSSAPCPAPAPAPAAGGPPPPPPPPTQEFLDNLQKARESSRGAASGQGSGMGALFSELNKGEGITSGLKKVTADMKAKNRPDRTGTVPSRDTPAAKTVGGAGSKAQAPKGEPKIELQQKRWVVENYEGNNEIILEDTTPQQTVYIYRCVNSVVQVKGKVNGISLDGCKGTGVVFDNVISSVEAVNCASCKLQFTGKAPTVNFDKCDGMQLYVPPHSVADPLFQVVTAKCSEINVVAMPEEVGEDEEPADPVEHAVPEQFISTFKDGKLVTIHAVHSAA